MDFIQIMETKNMLSDCEARKLAERMLSDYSSLVSGITCRKLAYKVKELLDRVKMLVELLEETEGMLQHTKCKDEDAMKCPACSLESRIDTALAKIKEET